jgi:DNA invertase Pin-like site-specific DNA recombinase
MNKGAEMTKQAYLYGRWSTLEQAKGSTLDRQLRNGTAFAEAKGLPIIETIIDEGRSAYTGANITTGNLGMFAKRVLSGAIDGAMTVLIVEELDRLSRQDALTMLAWLTPLLNTGLSIAVTQTGQIISREMMTTDVGGFMMLIVSQFGNNAESKKKAERVGAAWAKKRNDLRSGQSVVKNHRHPQWIVIQEGRYRLHRLRARMVREVFALNLAGYGKGHIAKLFNERALTNPDYAPWTSTKRVRSHWDATRIGRILHDISVIGLWQPHLQPRGGKRVPDGEPIALYPAAVDQDTFNRANDQRHRHQIKHQGKGRNLSNLLGPKARCGVCGGTMVALGSSRVRVNKAGERHRHYFLYCQNAKVAKTCDHQRGWTYERIEGPLLEHLLARAMDDVHWSAGDDSVHIHEGEAFRLRRDMDTQTKGKERLARMLRSLGDDDPELEVEYAAAAAQLKNLKANLAAAQERLAEARGKVSPAEHVRRVAEVRWMADSDVPEERYQARSRIKAALQDVLESLVFDPTTGTVVVNVIGGIAVMFIRSDASVAFFNLHRPDRRFGDQKDAQEQTQIEAWGRRSASLAKLV